MEKSSGTVAVRGLVFGDTGEVGFAGGGVDSFITSLKIALKTLASVDAGAGGIEFAMGDAGRTISTHGTVKEVLHAGHFFVLPADLFLPCKVCLQFGQGKANVFNSSDGAGSGNDSPFTSLARPVRPMGSSTKVSCVIVPCKASCFSTLPSTGPILSRLSV